MVLFVHEKTRLSIITPVLYINCLIALALGEECEGNAFGSVCLTVYIMSVWMRLGINNAFKDSSLFGDRTKYAIKVHHDVKHACIHYDVTCASQRAMVCHL